MNEIKPKRAARESALSEVSPSPPAIVTAPDAAQSAAAPEPTPESVTPQPPLHADSPADNWTALATAQAALARGLEAFALEATALTRARTAAATEAALALLGARTFADAVEINATLARREVDTLLSGGAKLSEIGVAAWSEASRPLLSRLGAWTLSS